MGLGILAIHFVDDFPVLEFDALAEHTRVTVDAFFELLGFGIKPNELPFAADFKALGVLVRCPQLAPVATAMMLKNTPERIEELGQFVKHCVQKGTILPAEAASTRGRMAFCRGQSFAKVGGPAYAALGVVADRREPSPTQVTNAIGALLHLVEALKATPPRAMPASYPPPVVLLTDGACEPDAAGGLPVTTVGAVLFRRGRRPQFFSSRVGAAAVRHWMGAAGKQQLVGQAEIAPVLLAKAVWRSELRGQALLTFVDNDSARHALVSGYSPVTTSCELISASALLDAELRVAQWVARVPTSSNIADAPSRLEVGELLRIGAVQRALPSELTGGNWQGLVERVRFRASRG